MILYQSFLRSITFCIFFLRTHDGRFNNSISSADYNKSDSGQSLKLSGGFRYDIAAWMIGALFVAGLLIIALYPRKRRRNHLSESTSACYVFPSNQNLKVIVDPACLPSSSSSEPVTYWIWIPTNLLKNYNIKCSYFHVIFAIVQ